MTQLQNDNKSGELIKAGTQEDRITAQYIIQILLFAALFILAVYLLRGDFITFFRWWAAITVLGAAFMPVTGRLFSRFLDKGWIFSKPIAIVLTGFSTWFLVSVKLIKFNTFWCCLICILGAVICTILNFLSPDKSRETLPNGHWNLVLWEEIIFLAAFLLWTYLAGFNPAANGTEKFMDYGFMEAINRSTTMPPADMWYSQGTINYYYGGQYFAVFLTKISGCAVELTYNLMRTFVAGLAFALPFSLVYQMAYDRLHQSFRKSWSGIAAISGIVAGLAVSVAGNLHYLIYRVSLPIVERIKGEEVKSYWFPDATRYIGYDPDVPDKTIHEFPCYSFVLGDLHAHVVNIIFVLAVLALLYSMLKEQRRRVPDDMTFAQILKNKLVIPQLILVSIMLGMFQWSNYWDFVIYYVVAGATVLFANIISLRGRIKDILAVTLAQAVEMMVIAFAVILPFNLQFTTMVSGVALAQNHSLPHQLLILWGLPAFITILFIVVLLSEKLKVCKKNSLYKIMAASQSPDLFGVILGLCAIGLVIIPELVYVRDIYENGNARANTMFKLTYQAYIMFGLGMGYMIFRLLMIARKRIVTILASICLILFATTLGYFGNAVTSWFGNVFDTSLYQGLDATAYLEYTLPEDEGAIRWLKENVEGSPVVLEANGDSYTTYERVSAMTGLPTVLGWYVHEWLWRSDTDNLNVRSADIQNIYTATDPDIASSLLEKYEVEYIFIGSNEKEKYAEALNTSLLESLGEVVYRDEQSGTEIIDLS